MKLNRSLLFVLFIAVQAYAATNQLAMTGLLLQNSSSLEMLEIFESKESDDAKTGQEDYKEPNKKFLVVEVRFRRDTPVVPNRQAMHHGAAKVLLRPLLSHADRHLPRPVHDQTTSWPLPSKF